MAAEARSTGNPAVPGRIGRYEPFLQIGAGGMARVYLAAQWVASGVKPEVVVVKILRSEVVEDDHALALFTDEARIAMRLDHPNVIRTREVVTEPPDYLLAMDFHDGRSLLDVVNGLGREAVPVSEHIYVLSRVLAGLSYAHELADEYGRPCGIVHRDVSPANVLVSYAGEVKVLDFGIAKATGALAATQDGIVRGKLGYAAPEQCLGQPADPRSDIYAVGVMLWEAVAQRRRVTGETWQSVIQARLEDTEPALEEVCPDAPPALTAIVRKAIARDPDDRYSTAREFQADLEKYLSEENGPTMDAEHIARMLRPHFDQDRADRHRSIDAFLNGRHDGKNGPLGRIPLPGGRGASPMPASAPTQEEHTAPIPVDQALLQLSRDEISSGPESSRPTALPPETPLTTEPPPPDTVPRPPNAVLPSIAFEYASSESAPTPITAPAREDIASKGAPAADAIGGAIASHADLGRGLSNTVGPTPKKKNLLLLALLLTIGALGLAAVVVMPRLGGAKTSAQPAPDPTGHGEQAHSTPTPAAPPKVDLVKVRISVDPADAVVKLDGVILAGNPYVATSPRDTAEHELIATAEGCKDHHQVVRLNADLALLVAMKCQRQGLRLLARPAARRPAAVANTAPAEPAGASRPAPEPTSKAASGDNPY